MASSPPSPSRSNNELALQQPEIESQLSSLIHDLLQRMQAAAEDMLKMTNSGIGEHSSAVTGGLMNCKGVALERKTNLEEEREYVQKAAFATLNMLNNLEDS